MTTPLRGQIPEPAQPPLRPCLAMQRSIVWWMMLIATLSVLASLAIVNHLVRIYLADHLRRDGDLLSEVIATSISGSPVEQWRVLNPDLVESLRRNPKIAFLCLTDTEGRILYTGVFQMEAWYAYERMQRRALGEGRLDVFTASSVRLGQGLLVRTLHVAPPGWSKEIRPGGAALADMEGALVLGLRDSTVQRALWRVQAAQLLTILVIGCVCFPLSRWLVRKWAKPLRELLAATQRLASGLPPNPVAVTTHDEMGYLSAAFNDMAARLIAGRHELLAANATLEDKVQQRTVALQEAMGKLERMASTDPLTGLANRRAFNEALDQQFRASVRRQKDLACLMLDLDGFKLVNDTLGHETGDRLLTLVARVLQENCRQTDLVGRLGGDEFIILMPGADEATARQVGERVLHRFQEEAPKLVADPNLAQRLSMSLGLSFRLRHRPESPTQLMRQADSALYHAKGSGKACLRIYEESQAA